MECASKDHNNTCVDSTHTAPPASVHAVREPQSWCPPPHDYSFAWGCCPQCKPQLVLMYTALAGGQLNCELCNLGGQKGKEFLLVHGVTKEVHPIAWQFCLSRHFPAHTIASFFPCRFLQTVRGVYVPYNIQPRGTLQLLLRVRNEYLVCILIESTNACGKTVYDNSTIHDFAVVRQRRLWFLRLLKIPLQVRFRAWQMKFAKV